VNIQEYISSGIVESYVLGLASEQERAEFERMCAAHPELRQAREAFEIQLEQQNLSAAVPPPTQLRSRILAELKTEKEKISALSSADNGVVQSIENSYDTRIVKMKSWWRYAAAASIVLLLASTALNFYFFSQYKSFSAKYDALVKENTSLAEGRRALQASFDEYRKAIETMSDPAMAIIRMAGSQVPGSPDPNSIATVYWDTRTKDVFLHVNNMPSTPSDKQYQLWAIVDGVPVDAGVFDPVKGVAVLRMKNIPRAQAFAVTLEKRGGSPAPTLDQMYVLGKVS